MPAVPLHHLGAGSVLTRQRSNGKPSRRTRYPAVTNHAVLAGLERLVGEQSLGGAGLPPDALRNVATNGPERRRQFFGQLGGVGISGLHRGWNGTQPPGVLRWPVDCDGISHACSFLEPITDLSMPITVGEHPAARSRSDDDLSGPVDRLGRAIPGRPVGAKGCAAGRGSRFLRRRKLASTGAAVLATPPTARAVGS